MDAAASRQQAAWDMFGAELARFEGSLVDMRDGTFQQVTGGALAQRDVFKSATAELSSLLALRDTYVELLTAEATDGATGNTDELRQELNRRYGAHTARHGYLNRRQTRRDRRTAHGAFRSDPYAAGVYALEDYDFSTDTATKSDIFTRAAVSRREQATQVETPAEALAICLDSFGEVRLAEIARLLALADPDEARATLGDLVFTDPDHNRLLPADLYLSGNVREKLAHVEHVLQFVDDDQRPSHPLQANVTALRKVIETHLPDKMPGDIDDVRLGAPWISPHYVQQFLREIFNSQQITVTRTTGADWTVEASSAVTNSNASTVIYGTQRRTAIDLVQRLLCNKSILVSPPALDADATRAEAQAGKRWAADETEKAQAKADEMNRLFADWLWNDPQRAADLLHEYNKRFNSWLEYPGDGSHLQLPGLSDRYTLRPHQKQAIARAIVDPGGSFFDHTVGFGKTLAIAATVMERRRLGLSNKPCIVVPNHLCDQWRNEFLKAYPGARVLAVDGADFAKPRRKEFVARIANGDWDVVILTQSVFDMIPLSASGQDQYVAGETENFRNIIRSALTGQGVTEAANPDHDPDTGDPISQAEDVARETDAGPRRSHTKKTIKNLQGELKRLTQKLGKHFTKESDTGISWEQTGIDFLAVDEVQDYANLDIPTRNSQLSLNGSARAAGLLTKLRSMARRYGPNVGLGASGTPFPNSMVQAFVQILFWRFDLLRAAGLEDFDAFAAQHLTTTVSAEIGPEGIPRIKERIGGFRNSLDFSRIWRTGAHVRTRRDIQLPVPDHTTETVLVPATDEDRAFMEDIADRAEMVRSGEVDASEDNLLSISNDGRMGAMDLRMVGRPASPIGKLDVAAQRIFDIWQATKDNRYTDRFGVLQELPGAFQMAFADRGTPSELNRKRGNFIAYDYLRDKLIELGMPAELIRYIHDAEDASAKELLFKEAREGKIALLLGSTQKMGTGVNAQDRCIALHHLDCPWRPADVEQREGRIIRQFNQNPQVKLFRYVQEGSFDSFMWQTVERKARFIEQIRTGRSIDDLDDVGADGDLEKDYLEFAEVKALATGNPLLLKKMQADKELALLETAYRSWRRTHQHLRHTVDTGADTLQRAQNEAATIAAAVASRDAVRQERGDDVRLEGPDGQIYTKRADLAIAIRNRLRVVNQSGVKTLSPWQSVAVLDGQHIQARLNVVMGVLELSLRGVPGSDLFVDDVDALLRSNKAPLGLVTRMENKVEGLDKLLERYQAVVGEVQMEINRATALVDKPFSKADQLAKARARVAQLESDIEGNAGRDSASDPADARASEGADLTPYTTADDAQTGEDAVIATFQAWMDEVEELQEDNAHHVRFDFAIEDMGRDIEQCRNRSGDETPGFEAWAYYEQRTLLENAAALLDDLATWNSSEQTRNLADRTRELQQATARHLSRLRGSGLLEQPGRGDPAPALLQGVPAQLEDLFDARHWFAYRVDNDRVRYAAGTWLENVIPAPQNFRASDSRPGTWEMPGPNGADAPFCEVWLLPGDFTGMAAAAHPEAVAELVDAAALALRTWGAGAVFQLDSWCRKNLAQQAPALAEDLTDETLPQFLDALRVQLFETHDWAQPDPVNLEAALESTLLEQAPERAQEEETEGEAPESVPDAEEIADTVPEDVRRSYRPAAIPLTEDVRRSLRPAIPLTDEAAQDDSYFVTSDTQERRLAVLLDPYDAARDLVEDRLQIQRTAQALFHAEKITTPNPAGLPEDVAAARSALIDADTVLELEPPGTVEDSLAAYTALREAAGWYAELVDEPALVQLAFRLTELTRSHLARFRSSRDDLFDLLPDANALWQALDHTPVTEAPPLPPVIDPYSDRAELAAARGAIFETYEAWPQAYADDGELLHAPELRGLIWDLRNALDEDVRHSAHAWERVLARGFDVAAATDADTAATLQHLLRLVHTHQAKLSAYTDRAERDATPYLRPEDYGDAEQRLLEQWAAWNATGYVRRLREIEENPPGDLITAVSMFVRLNQAMEVFEQQRTPDVRTRRTFAAELAASAHNLALALPSGDDAVRSDLARLRRFTTTAYAHAAALEHSEDDDRSAEAVAEAIASGRDRAPAVADEPGVDEAATEVTDQTSTPFGPDRWYRATLPDGTEQVTYGAWLNGLAEQLPDEGLQFDIAPDGDGFTVTTRAGVERIVPMAIALPDSAADHIQAIDELLLRTATDLYPLHDQAAGVLPSELARRLEEEFPALRTAAAANGSLDLLHEALLTRFLLVFSWAHPESSTLNLGTLTGRFDREQARLVLADPANVEYRFLRALAVSSSDPVLDGPPEPLDLGTLPEELEPHRAAIEELMLAAGRALNPYGLDAADNFLPWLERHRADPELAWLGMLPMYREDSDWVLYRTFDAVFRWSRSMADRLLLQNSPLEENALQEDTAEGMAPEGPAPEHQPDDDPVIAQLIAQDIAALAGAGWTEVVQPFASQREATSERKRVEAVYERWAATQTALPMLVDAEGELTDEEPGITNPAGFVASWFHRSRVAASTAGPTAGRMVVEQFEGLAQAARRVDVHLAEQDAYATPEDQALLLQVADTANRYAQRLAVTLAVLAQQQADERQGNQTEVRLREVRALESAMAYLGDQGADFRMDRRKSTITDREAAGVQLRDDLLQALSELAELPPERQNIDADSRMLYGQIRGIRLYFGWSNLGTPDAQAVLGFDQLPLLDRDAFTAADLEAMTPTQLIDRIDGRLDLDALGAIRDRELVAAVHDLAADDVQAEDQAGPAEAQSEAPQADLEEPAEPETAPSTETPAASEPQKPTNATPGPSTQAQDEQREATEHPPMWRIDDAVGEAAALDAIEDSHLKSIALTLGPFTSRTEAAAAQAAADKLYSTLIRELPRRPRKQVQEQRDLLQSQHEVLQGLPPSDADALIDQLWAMARSAENLTHHQDLPLSVAASNYANALTNLRARLLATPGLPALVMQMSTLAGPFNPADHPDPLGNAPEPYADAADLAAGRADIFEAFRAWPGSRRTQSDLADRTVRELRSRMRRLSETPADHRLSSAVPDWHNAMLEVALAASQREDPVERQQLHRLARRIRQHTARLSAGRHAATSDPRSVITTSTNYERVHEEAETARQAWEQTATYRGLQDLDGEVPAGSSVPAAAVAQQKVTAAFDGLRWDAPDEQLEDFRRHLTAYANAVQGLALTLRTDDYSNRGDQAALSAFLDAAYAHAAAVSNTRTSRGIDLIQAVLSTKRGQPQEDQATAEDPETAQPLPYESAAAALTDLRRLDDAHAALQSTNLGKRLLLASDDAPAEAVALRRAFLMPHQVDLAGEPQPELDRLAAVTGTTRALVEHLANTTDGADPTTVRNLSALADCAQHLMNRLTETATDPDLWTRLFSPPAPAPQTAPGAPEHQAIMTRQSVPTALRAAGHTVKSTREDDGRLRYFVDGTEMSLAQAADRHLNWGRDVPGVPGFRMAPISQADPTVWEIYEAATGAGHWQVSYSEFHKTWRIRGLTKPDDLPDTFATVDEAAAHAATTTPATLAMEPQTLYGLPNYTLRAVGPDEHANREVLNADGDVIATVVWSSFASQWAGWVGHVPTTLVSDPLIAAKHATVMWAYDAGISIRDARVYTSPADIRVTLSTLSDSRQSLLQAASRAWTADYANQPEIQQLQTAFEQLTEWAAVDAPLDTADGLGELITVLDNLRAPAIALRARLAEETRQQNEGAPAGSRLVSSDREQHLAFRLVALLHDIEGFQAGLRQTIERLPAAAASSVPSAPEATTEVERPETEATATTTPAPPARTEETPDEETSMTVTTPEAPIGGPWSDRIQLVEEDGGVFFTGTGQGDWYTQEGELRKLFRDNGFKFHRDSSRWRYQGAFNKRATAIGNVQTYLAARDEAARTAGQKEKTPQFPPTPQQQAIIDACVAGQNVVVQALAGTGKTTTMAMVARELSPKRVTYVAFNRDIADEARGKFPPNTDAATSHAFAARALRQTGLKQKVNNAGKNHPGARWPWQLTEALGINVAVRTKDRTYEPEDVARLVKATYVAYRNSADDKISTAHLPSSLAEAPRSIRDTVLRYARAAWKDIEDPVSNKVHFDFDDYLKLWALTKPTLPGEVIIFDEAQDINPVLSRVIQEQTHQTIVVGDSNQSIYAFRGAEDALTDWPADIELPLTQSWRFGTEVARIGNEFLTLLGSPFMLEGNPNLESTLGPVTEPDAVLAKTNAGALAAVVAALEQGRRVALAGGKKDIVDIADAAADLMAGRGTKHPELASFKDWDEVRELVERDDNDAKHLETFVRLVDAHSPRGLKDIAAQLVDIKIQEEELRAQVVVSTAHRSKGLEFDNVLIAGDFPGPKIDPETGEPKLPSPENLRLMYVAVTRAKNRLDLGSLQWIEDLPGLMADPRSVIPAPEQQPQPDTAPAEAPAPTTTDAPQPPTTDREPQPGAGQITPDAPPAVPAPAEPVPPAADAGTTSDPMALLGTRRPLPWDADTVARRVAAALQRARSMPGSQQPVDAAELREDPLAQYAANLERVLQTLPRDSTRRFINATALRLQERVNEIAALAALHWRQASESEMESPDALLDRLGAASTFPELNDAYTHEALHLVCNVLDEAEAEARRRGLKVNTVRDALDQVVGLNGSLTVDGEAVPQMHAVLYPVLRVLEGAQQRLGLTGEPAAQIPETEASVADPAPSTNSSPEESAAETQPTTPATETGTPDSTPAPDVAATAPDSGRQADPEEGQSAAEPASPTDEDLVAILEQWPVDQLAQFVRSMSGQRLITPGRMQVRFTPSDDDGVQGNAYALADCLLVNVAGPDGESVREGRVTWRHLSAWIDRRRTVGQRRLVNRAWDTRDRLQRSYAAYLAAGEHQHYQLALSELNDILRQAITALITDEEQEPVGEREVEPSELGELFSLDDVQPGAAPRGMTAFEAATANLRGRLTQYEGILPTTAESAGTPTALRNLEVGQCTVLPLAAHPFSAFVVGERPMGASVADGTEYWEVNGTLLHSDGSAESYNWLLDRQDGNHPDLMVFPAPRTLSDLVDLEPGVALTVTAETAGTTEAAQPEDGPARAEADAPNEETVADHTAPAPESGEARTGTEEPEGGQSGEAEPSADEQPTPEPAQHAPVPEPSVRAPQEALPAVFQAWHSWNASPTIQALLAEDEELRQETGVGGTNEVARLDDQWPLALREETVEAWQLLDDRCRDIAVAMQQGTLRLSDGDAGLLADLRAAISRQLAVMTRQAAETPVPVVAPEPASVDETQSPASVMEPDEEIPMSTPTVEPPGAAATPEISVDLGQLVTLIADELAARGVGQNPAPTVDLRPLEESVRQMQGQLGQVLGTLERPASAPPVVEPEIEARDDDALREALSEAQQQSAWFWGDPAWEHVRSLHQAYDHLTGQLRTTARAVRDGLFDDIRDHGVMRTVDALVARAVSHASYRIARRLDGNGQHTSVGYRVMWRLQRAAATRADRIMGRLEPDTDLNLFSGIQTAWKRLLERVRNWIRRDGTPISDGRTEAAAMQGAEQSVGLLTRLRQTAEDRLGDLRETTAWQQISSLISSAVETYNNIKENVQGWVQDFRELGFFATLWTRTMELVSSWTRDLLDRRAETGEEQGFRWNLLRLLHHTSQVQVERARGLLDEGEEPPLGFYDSYPTQTTTAEPGAPAPWDLPAAGQRLWEPEPSLAPFSTEWYEDLSRAMVHAPDPVAARVIALVEAERQRVMAGHVELDEAVGRLGWAVEQCLLRQGGRAAGYLAREQLMRPGPAQAQPVADPAFEPTVEPAVLWTALEALSSNTTSFDPVYLVTQGLLSNEDNAGVLNELWDAGYLKLSPSHAGQFEVDNEVPVRQILTERRRLPEVAPDLVRTAAFLATESRVDVTAALIESTLRTGPGQATAIVAVLVDRGVLAPPGANGVSTLLLDRQGVEQALRPAATTPPVSTTAAPRATRPTGAQSAPSPSGTPLPRRRESQHGQIGGPRQARPVATGKAAAGAALGALDIQAARMTDRAALLRHSDSPATREQAGRLEAAAGRARTAADSLIMVPSGTNGTAEIAQQLGDAFVSELQASAARNGSGFTSNDIKRAAATVADAAKTASRPAANGESRPAVNAQQHTQPGPGPRATRPRAGRP
ncbi:UvrD-helicase domain-containing protein [Streptomyces mirabilis]|uniref:UvrD-helicase domain-containing protein n=1 Tax=Streptomyces mirabilis TaxID=68239 RepID=UPI00379EF613